MIRRILEHNRLNGVGFSIVEFLLVAAVAALIGVGLGVHHAWIGVALAVGTMLNSLVVVAYGVAAWRRGERGNKLRDLRNREHREELRREHPTMMNDTLTLTVAVIVPYLLVVSVLASRWRGTG